MARVAALIFFAALLLGQSRAAERVAHWRVFAAGELPTVSVTSAPRGRILARQWDGASMTILDGYSSRSLALPAGIERRIYESRSGQLWSSYSEGLYLFQRGQWTQIPIAEIRQDPARQMRPRPVAVVPAEVNRVLFLLSDRLMEFDAADSRVSTLKTVSETGLGVFVDMSESFEGGLIVRGSNGVARVEGPLRHLTARSRWEEFLLETNFPAVNLQPPAELPDGSLIMVGLDRDPLKNVRHILRVGETGWSHEEIVGEKIRLVWPGWEGTLWASSYNGLFRLGDGGKLIKEGAADTYFDVATQTNGVFWLATSSGLIRYAPLLWRAAPELSAAGLAESPALAMTRGERAIWLATAEGLGHVMEGRADRIAWPEDFEGHLPNVDSIHETGSGRVVIGAGGRILLFTPDTKRFEWLRPVEDSSRRILGSFRDRSLCIRTSKESEVRLYRFDGAELAPFRAVDATNDLTFMHQARNGDLWFGGAFGLARLSNGETNAQMFGTAEGLGPERILCVADVGEDRVWAGSGNSIYELRGLRWEPIKHGILRSHSILPVGDGTIWVSAANGLHRYSAQAWLSHGDEEGLPSLAAHDLAVDRRGRLWAATSRGAVAYFPEADREEPRTSVPVISEEDESGRTVSVRFSGIDRWNYTAPERLAYSYRIDEGSWSPFTNANTATFRNLSAGPHYVQARALDRNGNMDPSVATLEFAVILPWSRDPRLLAVVLLALAGILFFAGVAINRHWRLKRSYAEVERMVAERTAQLEKANQELLHAQKMRALGTLASGIAHDFNNLLSIIKGSAQIIENNPDDKEKVLTRAGRIQTVVDQGAGIVRSMLGLGKTSDETECDLDEVVEETIRLMGDRFSSEVQLGLEKSATAMRLKCSKTIIQQILQNLILNAVDAQNGKGTVRLRTRVTAEVGAPLALTPAVAEKYAAIDVIDEGVGMPAEVLPRIFEPFYTTKAFSSRRGTGLGLSMVYELAKGLGYGLAVESTPGKGSTFTLLMPLS